MSSELGLIRVTGLPPGSAAVQVVVAFLIWTKLHYEGSERKRLGQARPR